MEKRKNQGVTEEVEAVEEIEIPVREKKFDNGKPKKVKREPSPVTLEEPGPAKSNKKM